MSPDLPPQAAELPAPIDPALVEPRIREYLSNERTYLSWMRTAISLLGIGVILARLRQTQIPLIAEAGATWQLGLIFAIVGLLTVFLSTQHYLVVRREIASDGYQSRGRWVILLSLSVLLLGSGLIYYSFTFVRH